MPKLKNAPRQAEVTAVAPCPSTTLNKELLAREEAPALTR
jgi:hypothetical protein